jgi:pimeloyl-ACP methyl ester carboxylesterase
MAREPVVLIHGYSADGESFAPWKDALVAHGYQTEEIAVSNYKSLTNEVTIKDIAEAFDRALRTRPDLDEDQPFNAIVHSTGMLVIRSWLATYAARRNRLKRLVGLAPATFGSPLAHKGRGFLGAIFKGNKAIGPDFLDAGDLILDGLELASRFTWDLTHADLLGEKPFYGYGNDTPYVFIFCGTASYGGIRQLVNEPGTDGTVRWAGCSLTTQKFVVDFSRDRAREPAQRVTSSDIVAQGALPMPFWPIAGRNHGSIVSDPDDLLVDLVHRALQVDCKDTFTAWEADAKARTQAALPIEKWQQFVVRAVDDRGDPIDDYHLELFLADDAGEKALEFDLDVHAYGRDTSLRCFHVDLAKVEKVIADAGGGALWARVIASSGSLLVGYHGINSEKLSPDMRTTDPDGVWDAKIELPLKVGPSDIQVFYPFTTTFVELRLNRDPRPFGTAVSDLFTFLA